MASTGTWDAAGRETLIENRDKNGVGQFIATNTYSAVNNRIGVLELDGTICTFGYDAKSQLTSEARSGANAYNTSLVYDPNGNQVKRYDSGALTQYTVNAANELLVMAPPTGANTTNLFDANGNLTVSTTGSAVTTNTWNPENCLTNIAKPDGTSEASQYCDDGLRVSKGSGPGKTVFTWDEQNLLLETDNSNNLQARYTDYPAYWGGLASQRRGGTSSFYGFDSQGSTRILVASNGAITDSYSYTAFGEILNAGSGTVNPMLYVGLFGYYADDTNLYYVRARWLAAVIASWLSRDPIGFYGGDWNVYRYVVNNPVKFVDASGLTWNLPPDFDPDFGGGGTLPVKPTVTCIYRCAGSCGWLSCYAGPGGQH